MDATYISANQFSVEGNKTGEFLPGRRIKVMCSVAGVKYLTIFLSSYSGSVTTVITKESELTSDLFAVLYGIVSPGGTGSIPDHTHDGSEGSGGSISVSGTGGGASTFLDLADTPSVYDEGKYLRSTASGTEWVTISGTGGGTSNVQSLLDLEDTPISYETGKYLRSTASGTEWVEVSEGSSSTSFLNLTDTPDFYEGSYGKYLTVAASGIEFADVTVSGGGTSYHDALLNLDYDSSGHTGFAPTAHEHIFLDLEDTPSSYDTGKYLCSTSSGIEFVSLYDLTLSGTTIGKQWFNDIADIPADQVSYLLNEDTGIISNFSYQSSGWLSGWTYRKSITLNRSDGAVTDYQMKLLVGESAGATGADVDCGGHCQADFDDLRFTTSDGTTLLSYWIESVSGTTPNQLATVWVEFNSIGTSATTFCVYYGNASAAAYSNIEDTFIFGDDFEDGSIDTARWVKEKTGNSDFVEQNGRLEVIYGSPDTNLNLNLKSQNTFSPEGKAYQCKARAGAANMVGPSLNLYNGSEISLYRDLLMYEGGLDLFRVDRYQGGCPYILYEKSWISNIQTLEIRYPAGGDIEFYEGSIKRANESYRLAAGAVNLRLTSRAISGKSGSGTDYYEYVFIRKYVSPEPVWGTWGSEETLAIEETILGTIKPSFTDLTDTPTTYSGAEGKYLRVTASGIEFAYVTTSGGGTSYHDALLNLDYDSSGHTGFAPTVHEHSTFSGTEVFVAGDATVTGTMYARIYDSYSPLTIKDGGVTVIEGDGSGAVNFPRGATVSGAPFGKQWFDDLPNVSNNIDSYFIDTSNGLIYFFPQYSNFSKYSNWLGTWSYRREVFVDKTKIDSDLTHFPLPIVISSSTGQLSQDLTDIFDEVENNWKKIAVTKEDGVTQLYVEVEEWDYSSKKALLWVSRSDFIISSSEDTKLFIYFDSSVSDNTDYVNTPGYSTGVWDDSTGIRLGFSQSPTGGAGCIIDSTSNANNGTPNGSMTSDDLVDGMLGKAIAFDGVNDYIVVNHNSSWKPVDDFSMKLVMKKNGNTESYPYPAFISIQADTYEGYSSANLIGMWHYRDNWINLRLLGTGGFSQGWGDPDVLDHQWLVYYISSSRGGNINYYLNGNRLAQGTRSDAASDWGDSSKELYIGLGEYTRCANFTIEEFKIESAARSESWQKADYYAQSNDILFFNETEINISKFYIGTIKPSFSGLSGTPSIYEEGKYLRSTASGTEWATVSGVENLVDLSDTPSDYGTIGQYLQSTGSGIEWADVTSGAVSLLDLTDTPATYSGSAGKYLYTTSSGIEFIDGVILTAPNNSKWLLRVTNSGTLYTESY